MAAGIAEALVVGLVVQSLGSGQSLRRCNWAALWHLSGVRPEHLAIAQNRTFNALRLFVFAYFLGDHSAIAEVVQLVQINKTVASKYRPFLP